MQAISIARSGLSAASARLTASASNVANAETSGALPSDPQAQAPGNSSPASSGASAYQPVRTTQSEIAGGGVQVSTVAMLPSYSPTYDPSAPYADSRGMVATPNVDLIDERIQQVEAKQAHAANMAVVKTADEMEQALLDIRT